VSTASTKLTVALVLSFSNNPHWSRHPRVTLPLHRRCCCNQRAPKTARLAKEEGHIDGRGSRFSSSTSKDTRTKVERGAAH